VLSKLEEDFAGTGVSICDAVRFIARIDGMRDAAERCRAMCRAYFLVNSQHTSALEGITARLLGELQRTWDSIDVGWQKIRIAFAISASLAKTSLEEGRRYLTLAENLKKEVEIQAPETAWAFIASIRLVIAAFSGLLRRQLENKDDIDRLESLISQLPSNGERALLWGDVALRYLKVGRTDDAKKIVYDRVWPLFEKISAGDCEYKTSVFLSLMYLLHRANPVLIREQIAKLPPNIQDDAWDQIVGYILRKEPLFEPYETVPGQAYEVTYAEMQEICDILHNMHSDWEIYSFMEKLLHFLEKAQC